MMDVRCRSRGVRSGRQPLAGLAHRGQAGSARVDDGNAQEAVFSGRLDERGKSGSLLPFVVGLTTERMCRATKSLSCGGREGGASRVLR